MNKVKQILNFVFYAGAFVIAPLFFFTDLTQNPFQIQTNVLMFSLTGIFIINAKDFLVNKQDKAFFFFIAVLFLTWFISLLLAKNYYETIKYSILSNGFILFVWAASYVAGKSIKENGSNLKLKTVINTLLITGFIAAFYGLAQKAGGEVIWPGNIRAGVISTFGNPNFLSSFLVVLFFPALYLFLENNKKAFYGVVLLVYALFIILCGARSSLLALAGGMVLFLVYAPFRSYIKQNKKQLGIFALILVVILTAFPAQNKFSKINEVKDILKTERPMVQSYDQRIMLWKGAFKIFTSNPAAGAGWGNFQLFYAVKQGELLAQKPDLYVFKVQGNAAHNFIFQLLAESGVLGLATFIFFVVIFGKRSVSYFTKKTKNRDMVFALLVSLAAMFADNMLNITLFITMPAFLFFFILGILSSEMEEGKPAPVICCIFIFIFTAALFFDIKIFISSVKEHKAVRVFNKNNYVLAKEYFTSAHNAYGGNYNALLLRGKINAVFKENKAAFEDFAAASVINSAYDELFYNAALMAYSLEKYQDSYQNTIAAIELNPVKSDYYVLLLNILQRDKKTVNADSKKIFLTLEKILKNTSEESENKEIIKAVLAEIKNKQIFDKA
ncbi:O-antigen polymerase [Elusimicrobium minutum Pei191]|uniref:O-antigen polymerase n=1 Tax=Elusimicrobium minutum (strain Pei191) TaxID=445932 RepID=B2KDP3_ELUMP|nr:O-antigen ligase family protein [Elusimicrobium minutum]ACC98639.1 O-antigen polymerase [Elusimicrobium minutum Pei191]